MAIIFVGLMIAMVLVLFYILERQRWLEAEPDGDIARTTLAPRFGYPNGTPDTWMGYGPTLEAPTLHIEEGDFVEILSGFKSE